MDIAQAPIRDPRYAPARLEVEERPDGTRILFNPTPLDGSFLTVAEPLAHWASRAPSRTWLAERSGGGWREVSYGEAAGRVAALAGGLRERGIGGPRPNVSRKPRRDSRRSRDYKAAALRAFATFTLRFANHSSQVTVDRDGEVHPGLNPTARVGCLGAGKESANPPAGGPLQQNRPAGVAARG